MRQVAETLALAEARPTVHPAIYIQVGDFAFRIGSTAYGGSYSCHNTSELKPVWTKDRHGRIIYVETTEAPWKHEGTVVLSNFDGLLNDIDLLGQRIYISWGAYTEDGPLYSTAPVMRVTNISSASSEGVLTKTLTCEGAANLFKRDEADTDYEAEGILYVGGLITDVFDTTMDGYTNCQAYNMEYDGNIDSLWGALIPGMSFVVNKGNSRVYTLARLFDMTEVCWKPGNEPPDSNDYDTVHFFIPNKVTPDYTFKISGQPFYSIGDSDNLIMPNEIVIKTQSGAGTAYEGKARDARSYNLYPKTRTEFMAGLTSDLQATQLAQVMLNNIKVQSRASSVRVPMACGAEIYDRIKVIDKRAGTEHEGNIGTMVRVFDSKKARYDMICSFGKWYDPRSIYDLLGLGAGYIGTEEEEPSASFSGQVPIALTAYASINIFTMSYTYMISTGLNDEAYITYKIYLPAGSYTLAMDTVKGTDYGIITVYIDDVGVASFDCYSASSGASRQTESVSVTESGWKTVKVAVDDKNASSSAYKATFYTIVFFL